jgi:hypothetical protein
LHPACHFMIVASECGAQHQHGPSRLKFAVLIALMPSLFNLLLLLLLSKLLLSLRNLRAPLISVEEYVCERTVCACACARAFVCVCVYLSMRDVKSEKYPRILT